MQNGATSTYDPGRGLALVARTRVRAASLLAGMVRGNKQQGTFFLQYIHSNNFRLLRRELVANYSELKQVFHYVLKAR